MTNGKRAMAHCKRFKQAICAIFKLCEETSKNAESFDLMWFYLASFRLLYSRKYEGKTRYNSGILRFRETGRRTWILTTKHVFIGHAVAVCVS